MLRCAPLAVVLGTILLAGCAAGEAEDTENAAGAVVGASAAGAVASADLDAAFAAFDHQRSGGRYATYYDDGRRVEGCWRNPAGKDLTTFQKAFYCAVPLELRACNSIVLLTTNEAKVEERYQGWLSCQKTADTVFGQGASDQGAFTYSDATNRVYRAVMLESAVPSATESEHVIDAHRPHFSGDGFPTVLADIVKSVAVEAADMVHRAFSDLFGKFTGAGGQAR